MKIISVLFVTACALAQPSFAATTLPVGPYGFNSYADFDTTFKRGTGSVQGDLRGFIYIRSGSFGSAVFDTSAAGGSGGGGGLTGSDLNNDLSDFKILADIAGSIPSMPLVGFYLRLDNTEANGYLASVQFLSPTQVAFALSEGASVAADGATIFSQSVPLTGLTLVSGSFYPFSVTANGGEFSFDFGNGAATVAFSDSSVSRTVGQAGFLLRNPQVQLDNFSVVPEPRGSYLLSLGVGLVLLARGIRRAWRKDIRKKNA
jgi:hypothetical protein